MGMNIVQKIIISGMDITGNKRTFIQGGLQYE